MFFVDFVFSKPLLPGFDAITQQLAGTLSGREDFFSTAIFA